MKRILEVCLVASTFAMSLGRTEAGPQVKLIHLTETPGQVAPPLQRGISVEMPVTDHAPPMPDADQEDALIVTVTVESKVYLGLRPTDLDALSTQLQAVALSPRAAKRVYIKADGWTVCTSDGSLSAYFEHTVAVTKNGPRVLTSSNGSMTRQVAV